MSDIFRAVFNRPKPTEQSDADIRNDERHLPRFARTYVRRVERFIETARPVRSGVGSAVAIFFLVSGLLAGAFQGGHGPVLLAGAGKAVGLSATNIVITGQVETTEFEVFEALGLGKTRSLVGFNADEARKRVAALPWVKEVSIRKLYPGRLLVALEEKDAFAVWQRNDDLAVVQRDGVMISRFGIADLINNRFSRLPHLVGDGAAANAREVLPIVERYPDLADKVQAYVRVGNRRWDIQFRGGVRVKLPEHDMFAAIEKLSLLDEEQQLLKRSLEVVDFRVADRVTLKLSEDAAKVRADFVADRLKAMKKADQQS